MTVEMLKNEVADSAKIIVNIAIIIIGTNIAVTAVMAIRVFIFRFFELRFFFFFKASPALSTLIESGYYIAQMKLGKVLAVKLLRIVLS